MKSVLLYILLLCFPFLGSAQEKGDWVIAVEGGVFRFDRINYELSMPFMKTDPRDVLKRDERFFFRNAFGDKY